MTRDKKKQRLSTEENNLKGDLKDIVYTSRLGISDKGISDKGLLNNHMYISSERGAKNFFSKKEMRESEMKYVKEDKGVTEKRKTGKGIGKEGKSSEVKNGSEGKRKKTEGYKKENTKKKEGE